jgi:hypothetical protein
LLLLFFLLCIGITSFSFISLVRLFLSICHGCVEMRAKRELLCLSSIGKELIEFIAVFTVTFFLCQCQRELVSLFYTVFGYMCERGAKVCFIKISLHSFLKLRRFTLFFCFRSMKIDIFRICRRGKEHKDEHASCLMRF